MNMTRRSWMSSGAAALAAGALLRQFPASMAQTAEAASSPAPAMGGGGGGGFTPVFSPDVPKLAFTERNGVKVGHLIAHGFKREFAPGLTVNCWGYNGSSPGPVIECVEGDTVRIYVTNKLPEPTSIHWHGMILPAGMDGVSGLTQKAIPVGETYVYEFVCRHAGTYMYHPHFDEMTQIGMGMTGMFIVHPRKEAVRVDRDFAIMLAEWSIKPGSATSEVTTMTDFNVLTMNSKAFPGTSPLLVKTGERIRIRFGNLSMMSHHPIHLHGFRFLITGTNGGRVPEAGQWPETTVLVPTGSTRDIEFVADAPGDWAMHCHMLHHVMNQMGHDTPNLLGIKAGDLDERMQKLLPDYMTMGQTGMGAHAAHMQHMPAPRNSIPMKGLKGPFGLIDMGGMFTILKVRDALPAGGVPGAAGGDPGWYVHPAGTVSGQASESALREDGIRP